MNSTGRAFATGAPERTSGSAKSNSWKAAGGYSGTFTSANESSGTAGFRDLCADNYEVSSEDQRALLVNNLVNTEIDIVLESPGHLYIGEAKYKSGFHANGKLVLVHQLVRQYVMANVLVDVLGCDRQVVPFVVTEGTGGTSRPTGNAGDPAGRPHQVQFMVEQGWMNEDNCLTWTALAAMASERPHAGIED